MNKLPKNSEGQITGFSFQGEAIEKDAWREVAADEVIHSDGKPAH